jgi:hypothetical protein
LARPDGQSVNSALSDIDNLDVGNEMQKPDAAAHGGADKTMVHDFVRCTREHSYMQIKN